MAIEWTAVADVLPEGHSGNVEIRHMVIDKRTSEFTALRAAFNPGRDLHVSEGRYAQLFVGGGIMMSDTDMEKRSNTSVCNHATGRVLIAGLGLGMIIHPIAKKPDVESITIVEMSPDVIKLVAPSLPEKAEVVEGDIFKWTPAKGAKFSTIYFDIWPDISTDNLAAMAKLHRRFARFKAPGAWMESWQRGRLQTHRRRERRDPYRGLMGGCVNDR
jgi:hypothetical protein